MTKSAKHTKPRATKAPTPENVATTASEPKTAASVQDTPAVEAPKPAAPPFTTLDNVKMCLDAIDEAMVRIAAYTGLDHGVVTEQVGTIAKSTAFVRGLIAADSWGQS